MERRQSVVGLGNLRRDDHSQIAALAEELDGMEQKRCPGGSQPGQPYADFQGGFESKAARTLIEELVAYKRTNGGLPTTASTGAMSAAETEKKSPAWNSPLLGAEDKCAPAVFSAAGVDIASD
jgi:hypothetical protein